MVQQLEVDEVAPTHTADESIQLRRDASEALRSASVWISGVSWLYRIGALAYGIATMFAIFALAKNEVPLEGGALVVAMTTLLTVLLLMGALHLHFKPFMWNIVIATLATGVAIVHFFGPNPLGVALPASIVLATLLWAAIVPTHQFATLIQKHRDLYILHHAGASTRRSLRGHTAEEKHERLVSAMRRAEWRAWEYSGLAAIAIAVTSAAGTYAIVNNSRPAELSASLEQFEAAWNRSDVDSVGKLYDARIRESETAWLAGRTKGLGWAAALPELGAGELRSDGDIRFVDYDTPKAAIVTSWFLDRTKWSLAKIELPLPDFEPALAAFLEDWKTSSANLVSKHFPEDHRAEMLQTIKNSVESLGWTTYPKVVDTLVSETDDGEKFVTLVFEKRRLRTRWHLRKDGSWRLHYMKFPTM